MAAMATIAQVREGLSHVGQQLTAGATMTTEIMGSVLAQLVVFVGIVTRLESDQQMLTTQMTTEVGGIRDRITQQQGALDLMVRNGGGPDRTHRPRGILESKAVSNLSMLGTDKNTFRTWNERLINVVSQDRYGSRTLFKAMMDYADQESGGNFEELFRESDSGKEMIA